MLVSIKGKTKILKKRKEKEKFNQTLQRNSQRKDDQVERSLREKELMRVVIHFLSGKVPSRKRQIILLIKTRSKEIVSFSLSHLNVPFIDFDSICLLSHALSSDKSHHFGLGINFPSQSFEQRRLADVSLADEHQLHSRANLLTMQHVCKKKK